MVKHTPGGPTMSIYHGQCLCGAVRFTIEPPSLFCAHCHCRSCRGAHGAAFVTWVGAADERFALSAGEDNLTWYESSEQSTRGFCTTCGTTLFYTSTLSPGEIHVALAAVEDTIDREPQAHVFHDHRVPWFRCTDGLPKIESTDPRLEKYTAVT